MIWLITFLGTIYGTCWIVGMIIRILRHGFNFTKINEEDRFIREIIRERKENERREAQKRSTDYLARRKEQLGW